MKKVIGLIFSGVISIGIGIFFPYFTSFNDTEALSDLKLNEVTYFPQSVIGILSEPIEITYIYESGQLLGAINDYSKIETMLNDVYEEKYKNDYPDTKVGLGEDVYITRELSLYEYEDIDDKIVNYIKNSKSYGIEVTNIEFSNSDGVYASIYVKDIQDYYNALDKLLLYFCDSKTLEYVSGGKKIPDQTTYGSQENYVDIIEESTIGKVIALPEEIMQTEEEILTYLSYGEEETTEIYVTVQGDTVEGVGSKNGLSAEQVMTLNPDKISSTTQLLGEGIELNVKYFDPIVTVVVQVESIRKEEIYPDEPEVELDNTLYQGQVKIVREEEVGYQNSKYIETYYNGQFVAVEKVSSQVTKYPVSEKRIQGNNQIPGVGTGTFRWPVDNPIISCGVGCYAGHRAIDIQNMYNRYGNIYASDRGTVAEASYTSINGYYVIIDHNNGLRSYYGHMNQPPFVNVGDTIDKGHIIGQIGMTGQASGPHVHFFILDENNNRPHPCIYLGCSY